MHVRTALLVLVASLGVAMHALAIEPADPDLSPEARRVLEYLTSVYGRKTLTAVSRYGGGPAAVLHMTGREPAISGTDICGFARKDSDQYHATVKGTVAQCLRWWQEKGGLLTLHYHWGLPGDPEGTAWGDKNRNERVRIDLAKATTPGTDEHRAVLADLRVTADYLKQLADAGVPVLWRPLHEIDGNWFWWTDPETPENTAALWRMMFDYFVKERGLHNLIWVYNAAHVTHGLKKRDATLDDEIAYRRRFYPGDRYVDIASIDTYSNPKLGWGAPWDDARRRAFELMERVAPDKMLAVGEDAALINPDVVQKEGPGWLYCLAWFAGGKSNPPDWMQKTFNHDAMLTLDELPLLADRNVAPNVRITEPADGAAPARPNVRLEGVAGDRNGNLKSVTVHALRGPWLNWFLRGDDDVGRLLPDATRLGEARLGSDGHWTFTWENAPAGYHNLVAFARDADGAVACSNAVRLTLGIENLARGRPVTASSTSPHGGPLEEAVDGDPLTMWWSDHEKPDPQWLAVDLGSVRTVGGVSVTWWKAYARSWAVQVSEDGRAWREVGAVKGKNNFYGDSDLIRFEPVRARHVRLHFAERAVTWQAYTVFEFAVYEAIPQ
jgi:hypothetical protein